MISSRSPEHFAGLGKDMISGFENLGWNVDYLTRFKTDDRHVIGIYDPPNGNTYSFKNLIKNVLRNLGVLHKIYKIVDKINRSNPNYITRNGRTIVSKNEENPVITIEEVLGKISNNYDFVFVYCWQDMLTSLTLQSIYQHLKVPIIISAYDFQPFTGGCSYFDNCKNYEHSCGACPILNSEDLNDQTRINFNYKKQVYSTTPIGVITNPYSRIVIERTGLFDQSKIETTYHPIDEKHFCPQDKVISKQHFNINDKYKFVIFARFAGLQHISKGYKYMIESVNIFADNLPTESKSEILLLLAGAQDFTFEKQFHIDVMNVGLLSTDDLITAYSAANVFLSTSIDDAGPSMVNQSIICGTPVVAFDIGSAQYMVDNDKTGYRVEIKDSYAMANALQKLYVQNATERIQIRYNCRAKGIEMCSLSVFCNTIINLSEKLEANVNRVYSNS